MHVSEHLSAMYQGRTSSPRVASGGCGDAWWTGRAWTQKKGATLRPPQVRETIELFGSGGQLRAGSGAESGLVAEFLEVLEE